MGRLINRWWPLIAMMCAHGAPSHAQSDSAFTISPGTYSAYAYIQQSNKILERDRAIIFGPDATEPARKLSSNATAAHARPPANALRFSRDAALDTPAKLAQPYAAPNRAQAKQLFADLLIKYHSLERSFGLPENDVAAGVAAFLAGSYMAYRNVDFPDDHFKPLVEQMRQVVARNPEFARASDALRQESYEQLAILGMFMASTQMALKERPDPRLTAEMKQAAKGYLEQFLKTDADRVDITPTGLVIR